MDRIHEVYTSVWKPPKGYMWSGERRTQLQATTRLDHLWPEIWYGLTEAAQKKEKQQEAIEIPKLDNARKSRNIHFIDPDDGEIKETIQHARKKLEIPMVAAVPCKMRTKKRPNKSRETDDETKGSNKIHKTKHACTVEAHESMRKRLESTLPKDHEDHIAGKGSHSMTRNDLVHKCILEPRAMKFPDAKAAVDKE